MKQLFNKSIGWLFSRSGFWSAAAWDFLKPFYVRAYLAASVLLNLSSWTLSAVIKTSLKDRLVILHYNILFGIDHIARSVSIFWLPFFGFLVIAFNVFLAYTLSFKREKLITHLLLIGAGVVNLFLLIALYTVYSINYINVGK